MIDPLKRTQYLLRAPHLPLIFSLLMAMAGPAAVVAPAIELIPRTAAGVQGNADSGRPSLSATGRIVAFQTSSNNLGYPASNRDILVFDRVTGVLERITEGTGGGASDGFSNSPVISGDGDRVAFISSSTDLIAGDTNGEQDAFLYVRSTGTMTRLSVSAGGAEADDISFGSTISEDGSTTAFASRATNLVAGDTEGFTDVFVVRGGVLERLSQTGDGTGGDSLSQQPSLSRNGDVIAFESRAKNLAPGKNSSQQDILVHDRNAGTFTVVSVDSAGNTGNDVSSWPSISADGRVVAFGSGATNLVPGDGNGVEDIFVHDRATGITQRVSVSSAGVPGNDHSFLPQISADGRYVAFYSESDNLVPGDTNGEPDFFIYDRNLNSIFRASVNDDNEQANDRSSLFFSFSPDGSTIAFDSDATNLAPDDTNSRGDVFVTENPLLIRTDALIGFGINAASARGGGVYTNNGALQQIRIKVKGRKKKRFYLFIQNDGLSDTPFGLRSNRHRKKKYNLKLIRLTGGSANITAAVTGAGFTTGTLVPNGTWICRGLVRGKEKRGRQLLTFTSNAGADPTVRDVSSLRVIAKP